MWSLYYVGPSPRLLDLDWFHYINHFGGITPKNLSELPLTQDLVTQPCFLGKVVPFSILGFLPSPWRIESISIAAPPTGTPLNFVLCWRTWWHVYFKGTGASELSQSFQASYMPPSHCQDPVSLGSPIFFILGIGETMDLADRSQGIKVFVEILSLWSWHCSPSWICLWQQLSSPSPREVDDSGRLTRGDTEAFQSYALYTSFPHRGPRLNSKYPPFPRVY